MKAVIHFLSGSSATVSGFKQVTTNGLRGQVAVQTIENIDEFTHIDGYAYVFKGDNIVTASGKRINYVNFVKDNN